MSYFQVVAECAHVTVDGPLGRSVQLLYKGAIVPAGSPQIDRLVELGMVAEVGKEETGGLNADGIPAGAFDADVPQGVTSTPVPETDEQRQAKAEAEEKAQADADLAEKRSAAKVKLPSDGSAPDGRLGQPVWVEYLVSKGSRYEDVQGADKDELQKLAKQQAK